jgi:hypothetical protein
MLNPIKIFKDKFQAFRVARQAGDLRELAERKNNGASNTYVPAKEKDRKKKRKQIAKASRRRNRK